VHPVVIREVLQEEVDWVSASGPIKSSIYDDFHSTFFLRCLPYSLFNSVIALHSFTCEKHEEIKN